MQGQLGRIRRIVGAVDAREVLQSARAGLGIEPFGIAPFAFLQWGINKDSQEFIGLKQFSGHFAFSTERRNKADQHDQSRIDHQFGQFRSTA